MNSPKNREYIVTFFSFLGKKEKGKEKRKKSNKQSKDFKEEEKEEEKEEKTKRRRREKSWRSFSKRNLNGDGMNRWNCRIVVGPSLVGLPWKR